MRSYLLDEVPGNPMKFPTLRTTRSRRRGTSAVEFAIVLPVFLAIVFGVIEISRIRMTSNLLNTACRLSARYGASEEVTTDEAKARVIEVLSTAMNASLVDVQVKDLSSYDETGEMPDTDQEYDALPSLELSDAEPRQMFLIRATVAYNDIALVPFSVMKGATLAGTAVTRHE